MLPPRERGGGERGGGEWHQRMRLRFGSPRRCERGLGGGGGKGLRKDAVQNGPSVLSAAVTPRVRGQGRPCPDALKGGGGSAPGWLMRERAGLGDGMEQYPQVTPPRRPHRTSGCGPHRPRARNAGLLSLLSVRVCPPATAHPLHAHCPPPAPALMQSPSPTSPDPALLTTALHLLRALSSSAAPTVPALTGGKGCGWRTTRPRCAAAPLHAWAGRGSDPAPCA